MEESIRQTHQTLAGLMRHEHASLALAQRCSALPAQVPLFTALLNYRHIVRAQMDEVHEQSWQGIEYLQEGGPTNYPLTLSVDDSRFRVPADGVHGERALGAAAALPDG